MQQSLAAVAARRVFDVQIPDSAGVLSATRDSMETFEHLDVASILELLETHADSDPSRLLFLWNLFEGVPKFYRDAYEQGVLGKDRKELIAGMFFRSSSPLRTEADNWSLSELRGRHDVVLKYVARHPGASNADIEAYVRDVSPQTAEQVGGYLPILEQKYRMIERRLPMMSKPTARRGRYYLRDNFLRSWLHALQNPVSAINFRPEPLLVEMADTRASMSLRSSATISGRSTSMYRTPRSANATRGGTDRPRARRPRRARAPRGGDR